MGQLFVIGAQRSGSTYLYHLLDEHPAVTMARPLRPEPKFFLDTGRYRMGRANYEQAYFPDVNNHSDGYIGEKSTSYIESPAALERIRDYYPNARILIILRNPILRAWSNYRFSVQHGLESLDFLDALKAEPERLSNPDYLTSVNPFAYRKRGLYIDYVELCRKIFSKDSIRIIIFEELVGSLPEIQGLYRWLGIGDAFVPASLGQTYNASVDIGEVPSEAFRFLLLGYRDSIARLEGCLGRRIDVWHEYFESGGGAPS